MGCLQYSYLLTSQLESQRIYWENKIVHLEKETAEEVTHAQAALFNCFDSYLLFCFFTCNTSNIGQGSTKQTERVCVCTRNISNIGQGGTKQTERVCVSRSAT